MGQTEKWKSQGGGWGGGAVGLSLNPSEKPHCVFGVLERDWPWSRGNLTHWFYRVESQICGRKSSVKKCSNRVCGEEGCGVAEIFILMVVGFYDPSSLGSHTVKHLWFCLFSAETKLIWKRSWQFECCVATHSSFSSRIYLVREDPDVYNMCRTFLRSSRAATESQLLAEGVQLSMSFIRSVLGWR